MRRADLRRAPSALRLALALVAVVACGSPVEAPSVAPGPPPTSETTAGPTTAPPPPATAVPTTTATTVPLTGLPAGDDTTVEEVVDGDTIVVAGGARVRLIGIDTPETKDPRQPVRCFGREASAHTAGLLATGAPVRLVYDVERFDRFGRTLAYVYRRADGLFVNAALVADGYASVATFPPNVAHVEELTRLARLAREEGRGLWGACGGDVPGTPSPATTVPPTGSAPSPGGCDPSYPGVCIPSAPPDLDCGDVAERHFQVLPPDPHGFDGNHDGVGCER